MKTRYLLALASLVLAGCTNITTAPDRDTAGPATTASARVLLASEVEWQHLNPARGDQSPRAGTLWGDRNGAVATGFLARFAPGFSSPPHIHNATYRAVVIRGLIHNDDPDAADMWMPAGSFWTQPKGETHITAASGSDNLALVEIDRGPYLVRPPAQAFDNGERPINVDASNIVWVDAPTPAAAANGVKLAYLWGTPAPGQPHGTFVRLPAGFKGSLHSHGASLHAVVIRGLPQYRSDQPQTLTPGSYFGSDGAWTHPIASNSAEETVVYVRSDGGYHISATPN